VSVAGEGTGAPWGDLVARRTTGGMRAVSASARAVGTAGWVRRLASSPLLAKILVADVLINVAAFLVVRGAPPGLGTEIMIGSLVVTVLLNAALVYWALLPLRALEGTAVRVSRGELGARVAVSPLADRNIARIGATLNALLDGLTADRARARALAAQVIGAGDRERAHIARELHDSTAQSLSALEMIITSALRDPAQANPERLRIMHEITVQALGEVRTLSHNVHPRVLDDLGLVAAVEYLARRTREQTRLPVRVTSTELVPAPPAVASVLYRVAQAAVSNAVRHARARELRIAISTDARHVLLEVRDDGIGFDPDAAAATGAGMGLFIMRERLALVDGVLEVQSAAGAGTTVRARVPVAPEGP
jgi:signal transduction histidine kinase